MLSKLTKKNTGEKSASKNWYADRYQSVLVQRNLLSIFSLLALLFSFVAIFMVYKNIPIVTVEPFVIQVEPKSGITEIVDPRTLKELSGDESLNNFFVVRYVRAYETVDAALNYNYETVRVMSEPTSVFRNYAWSVNPSNADSPLATPGAQQTVEIISITRLDDKPSCIGETCISQVRIERNLSAPGRQPTSTPLIIYMEYTYQKLALTAEERFLNPLGFQVLRYRVEKEIVR